MCEYLYSKYSEQPIRNPGLSKEPSSMDHSSQFTAQLCLAEQSYSSSYNLVLTLIPPALLTGQSGLPPLRSCPTYNNLLECELEQPQLYSSHTSRLCILHLLVTSQWPGDPALAWSSDISTDYLVLVLYGHKFEKEQCGKHCLRTLL